jgi:hypothetical protein
MYADQIAPERTDKNLQYQFQPKQIWGQFREIRCILRFKPVTNKSVTIEIGYLDQKQECMMKTTRTRSTIQEQLAMHMIPFLIGLDSPTNKYVRSMGGKYKFKSDQIWIVQKNQFRFLTSE